MRIVLSSLVCSLLLACGQESKEPPRAESQANEPLSLDCLSFHSTVVFAAQPELPQVLEAIYQGPDKAHWWFGRRDESGVVRRLRYRAGNALYSIEPGSSTSTEIVGPEHATLMLRIELRRALMLWPDGFAWQPSANGQEVELADGSGRLRVELAHGEPTRFTAQTPDGDELESFGNLTWQEFRGRRFPSQLTLQVGGALIWTETITRIVPDCQYASFFFTPADRRESGSASSEQTGSLRHLDLPARFEQRIPLDTELTWTAVRTRAKEELARAAADLPQLADRLEFAVELGPEAAPTALLLLLTATDEPLPPDQREAWNRTEQGPALSVLLSGLPSLTPGMIGGLARFLPPGARQSSAYLRLPSEDESTLPLQLVMRVEAD